MNRRIYLNLSMGLLLLGPLAACSSTKHKNPVASAEEVGKVEETKLDVYTTKDGDTLRKIAGSPEIYGDPDLWPLLQEANADLVGPGVAVNSGIQLKIPRDLSDDQLRVAREKARQFNAEVKMTQPARKQVQQEQIMQAQDKDKDKAKTEVVASATNAQSVPQAKKGKILFPVLFVLLLILLALAILLFYFMKRTAKRKIPSSSR